MPNDGPTLQPNAREIKGKYVVVGILLLTAVVGTLFIYIGPRATAKRPGVVHVGVRFADEATIDFLRYGKKGPLAELTFLDASGEAVDTFADLRMGRNLVPLEGIPSGTYRIRIESAAYEAREVVVEVEGRMLNPPQGYEYGPGTHADYNMVGVVLQPRRDEP